MEQPCLPGGDLRVQVGQRRASYVLPCLPIVCLSGAQCPRGLLPLLLHSRARSKTVNYSFSAEWNTFQSQGRGLLFSDLPRAKSRRFLGCSQLLQATALSSAATPAHTSPPATLVSSLTLRCLDLNPSSGQTPDESWVKQYQCCQCLAAQPWFWVPRG